MKISNRAIKLIVLLIMVFITILFSVNVLGDVGNSVSHRRSSSSSGKSPSYNRSSSSNSGSGGSPYSVGRRDYGGYSSNRYGGIGVPWFIGGFGSLIFLLIILGIGFILYKVVLKSKLDEFMRKSRDIGGYQEDNFGINNDAFTSGNNISLLKEGDPNFSEPAFIAKVNNMYVQLQDAWMKKSWKSIRPFETDTLFNTHAKQLQKYIDSNTTNVVDNICILESEIVKYEDDGVNDIVDVRIKARINDYIVKDDTKEVISGDPNEEIFMTYIWKMIRKKGVLTNAAEKNTEATQCPNCGANVSINESGECEYCGSVISKGNYDWVLSSIEVLDQE